ncbi:MAG: signal recognition particle-docking protein FtsY [Pedosphaera sp.]|nr:signal recognition particle-docking protein FtsY [Pedosphaera sp.]
MGLFDRFRAALGKTHAALTHEIKRVFSGSPKLDAASIETLETTLLSADFGVSMTERILKAVKSSYESQGGQSLTVAEIAQREVVAALQATAPATNGTTSVPRIVSVVGVNGTGKTTTCAKLAYLHQSAGHKPMLAACDTFRAAAVDQLKIWGDRLNIPVIAGAHGADPAAVAHDAVVAAESRGADWLFIDTAGRMHTKANLMKELQKIHRVVAKKSPGAPHDVLLVLDASTGMNAFAQAREFHSKVHLTGLVITKLDGTSKAGMIVAIQHELGIPVRYIGLGENPDDLQPFDATAFAQALFTV